MSIDSYTWIHDSLISEAGCVTVVPAGDADAVLAAFGVDDGTPLPDGADTFGVPCVFVRRLGDAVVALEDNGFQGVRPEVLGPLSRASAQGAAASFFWNVNGDTAFATATDGEVDCELDLGLVDDEDLEDLPESIHELAREAGDDDGDPVAGGVAMVAAHTEVELTPDLWEHGAWFELVPVTSAVQPSAVSVVWDLPGADEQIRHLPAPRQRALAAWSARAAVRESGLGGEPSVREALAVLDAPGTPELPTAELDELQRRFSQEFSDFSRVEESQEDGGPGLPAQHRYHEVCEPYPFGERRAVSHLEGCYLKQRVCAVDALRHTSAADPAVAAAACLQRASTVYSLGRTTRGWTYLEDDGGRYLSGSAPQPRHEQFLTAVRDLLRDLEASTTDAEVWARADAALPAPLSADERRVAIHADALAAARGEFDEYQVEHVDVIDEPYGEPWGHGFADAQISVVDVSDGPQFPGVHHGGHASGREFLRNHLDYLDAMISALERPDVLLRSLTEADDVGEDPGSRLEREFGWSTDQAEAVLGMTFRLVTRTTLEGLRESRQVVAFELARMERDGPDDDRLM